MPGVRLLGVRLLVAALAATLGLALLPAVALVGEAGGATAPRPGPSGIGDPYFPLDGNGGIDVLSYDVHDRYDLATGTLSGWTDLRVRGLEPLSSFNLDFLLPVASVRVGGASVGFTQGRHELAVAQRLVARS